MAGFLSETSILKKSSIMKEGRDVRLMDFVVFAEYGRKRKGITDAWTVVE